MLKSIAGIEPFCDLCRGHVCVVETSRAPAEQEVWKQYLFIASHLFEEMSSCLFTVEELPVRTQRDY